MLASAQKQEAQQNGVYTTAAPSSNKSSGDSDKEHSASSSESAREGSPEGSPEGAPEGDGKDPQWGLLQSLALFQTTAAPQPPSWPRDVKDEDGSQDDLDSATREADSGPRWGILEGAAYRQRWQVPWGAGTTIGGFLLWVFAFGGVAFLGVPGMFIMFGVKEMSDYTQLEWAYYAASHQVVETVASLAAIAYVTRKGRRALALASAEPSDLFRLSLAKPFRKGDGWLVWALLGIVAAPFVIGFVATGLSLTDFEATTAGGKGTVDAVAQLINVSWPSYLSLMSATAVLAPLLEETVFRGFLLTSLTKFMSAEWAVLLSSVAFGAAHLSARDFPQLTALGIVMGFSYVRSRNLMTPILIHGTWNGVVLSLLFILSANGYDLTDIPSW